MKDEVSGSFSGFFENTDWLPENGSPVSLTIYADRWFPWWKRWWYVLARRYLHRPWPQEVLAYVPRAHITGQTETVSEVGKTINVRWSTDGRFRLDD